MPYHRTSTFAEGPRVTLDRERRAVWKARVILFRRARKITAAHEDIALAMLGMLGTDGRLDPTHETIAFRAGYDARTVRRALDRLKGCGLVIWAQRIVREGWRVIQTSNAYALTIGELPAIPVVFRGGQTVRGPVNQEFKKAADMGSVSESDRQAAREALARVAERRRGLLGAKRPQFRG